MEGLIIGLVLYIISSFMIMVFLTEKEYTFIAFIENFNLYETILFLPWVFVTYIILGIVILFKKLFKLNFVQVVHKFMLQTPSDLINFRIVVEKRDN